VHDQTGVVGAKSKNIANLRGKLPSWIALPASVTIPFGSFETALEEPTCAEVRAELEAEVKRIPENPAESLRRCREIIMGMTVPEPLKVGRLPPSLAKSKIHKICDI
jgi:alpha-glucan,water dikinase